MSNQQDETLSYFRAHAVRWRDVVRVERSDKVNVPRQRMDYVVHVVRQRDDTGTFLDIGCGSGELPLRLCADGWKGYGIDFSPEMIAICRQSSIEQGVEAISFFEGSIFERDFAPCSFDVVSALGFIEYISPDQLDVLLKRVTAWLAPGGAFVVSVRNRLYNLFSLNEYSLMELASGAMPELVRESIMLSHSDGKLDWLDMLAQLQSDLPMFDSHPRTQVKVSVRHQYTPSQIIRRMKSYGLETCALSPVHYHAFTPALKEDYLDLHTAIANEIQTVCIEDRRAIPQSSVFMVHARKA